jgi:hypothetical protein
MDNALLDVRLPKSCAHDYLDRSVDEARSCSGERETESAAPSPSSGASESACRAGALRHNQPAHNASGGTAIHSASVPNGADPDQTGEPD